jgi:hypothetical protein
MVHKSQSRHRVVAAGARFGKSMLGGAEIVYGLMIPDYRMWAVSSQYELAEKELNWAMEFLGNISISRGRKMIDLAKISSAARGSRVISFPWGSFCRSKSCEKPQSLLGEELNLIVFGEGSQVPRLAWERMLRARIGPRRGGVLSLSTPNADAGLFKDMFDWGQDEDEEYNEWKSWQFSTLHNPTFDRGEWEIAKRELDEDIFKEQYEGEFISRRGKVFKFSKEHIFDDFPDGFEHWVVLRSVQRGFTNPFVVLFASLHPERRDLWIWAEHYELGITPEDVVSLMHEKTKGKRVLATWGDYYDPDGKEQFSKAGVRIAVNDEKKINKKFAQIKRIQAIQNALKIRDDGTTRIHIHRDCVRLIEEMEKCKWPDKQKEEAEKAELETPLTKYLQGPLALSHIVTFVEIARGIDVYAAQSK